MEARLIGFNLTKVEAEKNPDFDGELEIKSNIVLKELEKYKPKYSDQESLKVTFEFGIDYKELGKVTLHGTVFVILDNKTLKEALKQWKDKKLPEDLNMVLINIIMQRSSLRALQLEEELGLPFHFQLPRLQAKASEEESK